MTGPDDDLAERLDAIAEELAERAVQVLRDAVDGGATSRPERERRLTQARRAVERAAAALRVHARDAELGGVD